MNPQIAAFVAAVQASQTRIDTATAGINTRIAVLIASGGVALGSDDLEALAAVQTTTDAQAGVLEGVAAGTP